MANACTKCGAENPPHFVTCGKCGALGNARPVDDAQSAIFSVRMTSRQTFCMPVCCACCLLEANGQTSTTISRSRGGTSETLTVDYPMCEACLAHDNRKMLHGAIGLAIGLVSGSAYLYFSGGVSALRWTVIVITGLVAIAGALIGAFIADKLWPPYYHPGCTSEGHADAVTLAAWDDQIQFDCTNPTFGQLLQQANP